MLLTPAHHFTHGVSLHRSRRTAVVDWAERTGGYVLEDDYDGEFRYDRQPIGAVQGLAPVLRLGWMVLPDDLVDPVISAAGGQQIYVNGIIELTMADFITSGNYDRHIRCMRNCYRRRRGTLLTRWPGSMSGSAVCRRACICC